MSEHHDDIIIGGGVVGLCMAYHLAKAGAKPLILEQFNLPHTRGSSHGQSRLIRTSHIEDSYAALCSGAYQQWKDIEERGGQQLLINTGLLLLQDKEGRGLRTSRDAMDRLNLPYEWIDGRELKSRYPMVRYSEDFSGILDKTASIILADKATDVLRKLVEKEGVLINDGEKVLSIKPGPTVTIVTSKSTYTCKRLFVTTGPWSKEVTDDLGLNLPITCIVGLHLFWKTCSEGSYLPDRIPMFYHELENESPIPYTRGFFGLFPTLEYPGLVKVVTRGEPPPFYCHPDARDKQSMQPMVDLVSEYIQQHFPDIETKPSIVEPCMYCMTPDKNGIIDRHPKFPNIMIGTAFSGKGFMLAPVVGKVLTELSMGKQPSVDVGAFSIGRFSPKSHL